MLRSCAFSGTTASMRNTKLIRLTDAEGAFNGWSSNSSQGVMFNHLEMYFMLGGDWGAARAGVRMMVGSIQSIRRGSRRRRGVVGGCESVPRLET